MIDGPDALGANRLRDTMREAAVQLAAAGVSSPRVDAELLAAHVLGVERGRLPLIDSLTASQSAELAALLNRRVEGVPVQHLTGRAPFRHLEVAVGPGVFVPRPETELLLDLAAAQLGAAGRVVDLCAGSGAIALAVAQEHAAARVLAVERSVEAFSWLRRNADERVAAGDRSVQLAQADVRSITQHEVSTPGSADERLAWLDGWLGQVDVVLSNPPYVPARHRELVDLEVRADPDEAVFGGSAGLDVIPAVLAAAAVLLRADGMLVLEHDESQPAAIAALLADTGNWRQVRGHRDLTGRPRFTSAIRASEEPHTVVRQDYARD
ncbi:MAG: N5-glutamine S-adenosyl-L-methionine-dependent methyltransferase [Frankiales bacterium]|nr:N5-glutamine S-adenosyl-L-methionine-dependent methyltransferase [Frankiales bacterium]